MDFKPFTTRYVFIVFLLFQNLNVNAQITQEFVLPSALVNPKQQFFLTQISPGEYKYCYIDYNIEQFNLYNLDYTIYKTVNFNITSLFAQFKVHYISSDLFDCDTSNIEYLFSMQTASGYSTVEIFREDGTSLFFADSSSLLTSCFDCYSHPSYALIRTPAGTKMILEANNSDIKIYNLCGTLPIYTTIPTTENELILGLPHPNPAKEFILIPYQLPNTDKEGILSLYDAAGSFIREMKVHSGANEIKLTLDNLKPGIYFYQIITSSGVSLGRQIIRI